MGRGGGNKAYMKRERGGGVPGVGMSRRRWSPRLCPATRGLRAPWCPLPRAARRGAGRPFLPQPAWPSGGSKHKLFRTEAAQLARQWRRSAAKGAAGKVLGFPASEHTRPAGYGAGAAPAGPPAAPGVSAGGSGGGGMYEWRRARGTAEYGVRLRVWKSAAASACETMRMGDRECAAREAARVCLRGKP